MSSRKRRASPGDEYLQAGVFAELGIKPGTPDGAAVIHQMRSAYDSVRPVNYRSSTHRRNLRQAIVDRVEALPDSIERKGDGKGDDDTVDLLYRLVHNLHKEWRNQSAKAAEPREKTPAKSPAKSPTKSPAKDSDEKLVEEPAEEQKTKKSKKKQNEKQNDSPFGVAGIPNVALQLINANNLENSSPVWPSDFLAGANESMERSTDGNWVNSGALQMKSFIEALESAGWFHPKQQQLWWNPQAPEELDLRTITTPQEEETELTSSNLAAAMQHDIAAHYPDVENLPMDYQGRTALQRPVFTLIIRRRDTSGDGSPSEQLRAKTPAQTSTPDSSAAQLQAELLNAIAKGTPSRTFSTPPITPKQPSTLTGQALSPTSLLPRANAPSSLSRWRDALRSPIADARIRKRRSARRASPRRRSSSRRYSRAVEIYDQLMNPSPRGDSSRPRTSTRRRRSAESSGSEERPRRRRRIDAEPQAKMGERLISLIQTPVGPSGNENKQRGVKTGWRKKPLSLSSPVASPTGKETKTAPKEKPKKKSGTRSGTPKPLAGQKRRRVSDPDDSPPRPAQRRRLSSKSPPKLDSLGRELDEMIPGLYTGRSRSQPTSPSAAKRAKRVQQRDPEDAKRITREPGMMSQFEESGREWLNAESLIRELKEDEEARAIYIEEQNRATRNRLFTESRERNEVTPSEGSSNDNHASGGEEAAPAEEIEQGEPGPSRPDNIGMEEELQEPSQGSFPLNVVRRMWNRAWRF